MGRIRLSLFLATALALLFGVPAANAQEAEIDVRVKATIDDRDVALTGQFKLKLEHTPNQDVGGAFSVQIVLAAWARRVLTVSHAPPKPTLSWKMGLPVAYEVPVPFPFDADLSGADFLDIRLGFVEAATGRVTAPANCVELSEGLGVVARIEVPRTTASTDEALAAAEAMVKEGRRDDAWAALQLGLRRADGDPAKLRFRDAMSKLGASAPPLSIEEEQIVAQRIDDEKRRCLRIDAGRFFDRRKYHAALRVLDAIGGKLEEQGSQAVLGAVNEQKRVEKDAQDIREKMFEDLSKEEQAEADAALKSTGLTREVLRRADEWVKQKKWAVARYALNKLYRGDDGPAGKEAWAKLKEVEKAWAAWTPPDEQALVDASLNHPSFARTKWVASREFIFIGPKTLVEGIPAPSKLRFDLSYVFLTDLFGRRPNPGGDRVTVYFKELFDFGGGIGGGKTIDIGKADPNAKETRVDNGLLYHELTHCVDDTNPIHEGFREGLANFGAAYCFEAMGQNEDVIHSFQSNIDAFRRDYLARDLEYWRIENYGPSAGFFLHFVEKYAKTKTGHDWAGYRRFFREYRSAPIKEGREPFVIRAIAHHLVNAFGPGAFDDLVAFRFPLVPADRDAIEREIEAWEGGEGSVVDAASALADAPNSPLPRDVAQRRLVQLLNSKNDEEARSAGRDELGILYDWRGIGPFQQAGADPGSFPFPPEYEIDFGRDYPGRGNVCRWTEAKSDGAVKIDASGWVTFDFSYQDDTASYALTHATVPADTDGWAYFRADDDLTLFVNGEAAGSYEARGILASMVWWRGPMARMPDAMRLPVRLRKGRNRILVKIRNRGGPSGFVLALCRRDGKTVEGLVTDRDAPAPPVWRNPPPPEDHWKRAVRHDFAGRQFASWLGVTAGRFEAANKALSGAATDKSVAWRKYTVRPGFPKDAPSNLAWLAPKLTENLDAFRLTLDVGSAKNQAPKIAVTFQGEGETDGLSGWTLILRGAGDGKAKASLERYDRQVCESANCDFTWGETIPLVVAYEARRVSVWLANATLLADVPIEPIPGRNRIGFATWGAEPRISGLTLDVPRK